MAPGTEKTSAVPDKGCNSRGRILRLPEVLKRFVSLLFLAVSADSGQDADRTRGTHPSPERTPDGTTRWEEKVFREKAPGGWAPLRGFESVATALSAAGSERSLTLAAQSGDRWDTFVELGREHPGISLDARA